MFGWKHSARSAARSSRRKPVLLNLESLEKRELLDAGSAGQAATAFLGDLAHLRNDVAKAEVALINAAQPSAANQPPLISVANQWNKVGNILAAD